MFDRGHFGTNLDHSAEGLLPGERFDADQQCLLKYGKNSVRSSTQQLAEVCRDLHCQRDRYTWTSHPSLEGTHCGDDMVCLISTFICFYLKAVPNAKWPFHSNHIQWCKAGACVSRQSNADQTEIIKLPATTLHIITANSSRITAVKVPATTDSIDPSSDVLIDDITDTAADDATAGNIVPSVVDPAQPGTTNGGNNGSTDIGNDNEDDDNDNEGFVTNGHTSSSSYNPVNVLSAAPLWSDWTPPSDCESGCLFGESGRLREGSTGLRVRTRVCLDTRTTQPRSCQPGRGRRYEACSSRQCYHVPRTTVLQFAQQVCERAGKFDKDIAPEGLQMNSANANDSCRVWCRSRTAGAPPRTKSWTFPDGTTCRVRDDGADVPTSTTTAMRYCVAGVCEKFKCSNRTTNLFRADSIYCPDEWTSQQQQQQSENSVLLERVRDLKSLSLKTAPGYGTAGIMWDRSGDRMGGRTPVRRNKYAEPPLPPRQIASTALSSSSSISSSSSRSYDVPFYSPNARSWRYKGVDVQRVGKYQRIPKTEQIPPDTPIRYTETAAAAEFPSSSDAVGIFAPTSSIVPSLQSSSYSASAPGSLMASAERQSWRVRSGCHFGCMALSKGIQIVESDAPDRKSNIQLCEPETIVRFIDFYLK